MSATENPCTNERLVRASLKNLKDAIAWTSWAGATTGMTIESASTSEGCIKTVVSAPSRNQKHGANSLMAQICDLEPGELEIVGDLRG